LTFDSFWKVTISPMITIPTTPLPPPNEEPLRRPVTPEEVMPHPRVAKTGPRQPRAKNRGASRVLTNSPEMAKLEETYDAKKKKENETKTKHRQNLQRKNYR